MVGIACIAYGLFLFSSDSASSWYNTMTASGAYITAGFMLYLGWVIHMGMDMKNYDNSGGGGRRIFLDKPA